MVDDWETYRWVAYREAARFKRNHPRKCRGLTVEDLATTGMHGLYKAARTYESGRGWTFVAWAVLKVTSEINDWAKLGAHQFELRAGQFPLDAAPDPITGNGQDETDARDWWHATLQRLQHRVNPRHFEIARLMGEGRWSQRQIAEQIGIRESAVSQAWHTIQRIMRAWAREPMPSL